MSKIKKNRNTLNDPQLIEEEISVEVKKILRNDMTSTHTPKHPLSEIEAHLFADDAFLSSSLEQLFPPAKEEKLLMTVLTEPTKKSPSSPKKQPKKQPKKEKKLKGKQHKQQPTKKKASKRSKKEKKR